MKNSFSLIFTLALCFWLTNTVSSGRRFITFHPVAFGFGRNAVDTTRGGFITNGVEALKSFSNNWLPNIFNNFSGTQRNARLNITDSHNKLPLCVFQQPQYDIDYVDSDNDDNNDNDDEDDVGSFEGRAEDVPIMKCVVIVKLDQSKEHKRLKKKLTTTTPSPIPPTETPNPYPYQEQDSYNYAYQQWYNSHYNYPQKDVNTHRNEENDLYNNNNSQNNNLKQNEQTLDNSQWHDLYAYYLKKQRNQKHQQAHHGQYAQKYSKYPYYDYRLDARRKRDHEPIQSYEEENNVQNGGYQPAVYPKANYQSQYPKVTFSSPISYSSPVFIRNAPVQMFEDFRKTGDYS